MQNSLQEYLGGLIDTGKPRGFGDRLILGSLRLLELIYRGGVYLRNGSYAAGLAKKVKLPCTVISVGNIMAGGTGKTPVVEYISESLTSADLRVSILTRGYRSKLDKEAQIGVVSDGTSLKLGPEDAGDEAFLLAANLPEVPVIVGKDRAQSGSLACTEFASEVLVLDDGFQYRRLYRDIDIVVINATNPFGNRRLIPRGLLREGPKSLQRANIIICTHAGQVDPDTLDSLRAELKRFNSSAVIFTASHQPTALIDLNPLEPKRDIANLKMLSKQDVLAVSGIGNPKSFTKTLESLGAKVVKHLQYPDHHYYGPGEMQEIVETAKSAGLSLVITTQKDAVKMAKNQIHTLTTAGLDLYMLRVSLKLNEEEQFTEYLLKEVRK